MAVRERAALISAWLFCTPLLAACSNVQFYDEGKDKAAEAAKKKYADAKLTEVLNGEEANLDKLLATEIKAISDNRALQLDIRFLRMANDRTPLAESAALWADRRIGDLGFSNTGQMREALKKEVEIEEKERSLDLRTNLIVQQSSGLRPPPCDSAVSLPAALSLGENATPAARALVPITYDGYRRQCAEFLELLKQRQLAGELREAANGVQSAARKSKGIKSEISMQKLAVADARKAYEAAVAAGKAGVDAKTGAEIREKAERLNAALDTAKKFDERFDLGILAGERVQSISALLVATASGKVDAEAQADKNLSSALVVAASAPALVDSVQSLKAKAQAPPVSGLLIELRHQLLLVDHANKRLELMDRRTALAKVKFQALLTEAQQWLAFKDELCGLAKIGSQVAITCDTIVVTIQGNNVRCTHKVGTAAPTPIANCPYEKPWNAVLDGGTPPAKRAADSAVAALSRATAARSQADEIDFRLVDVEHREVLAANRAAIQAWDNLIAGPTDQLATYYKSGLKPYEIGDLIVKALGLTAIAIGVAQ